MLLSYNYINYFQTPNLINPKRIPLCLTQQRIGKGPVNAVFGDFGGLMPTPYRKTATAVVGPLPILRERLCGRVGCFLQPWVNFIIDQEPVTQDTQIDSSYESIGFIVIK
jgi:hypothetical protein